MLLYGCKPIRIFLLDQHTIVREGLRALIEPHPDLQVVGEASNYADAFEAVSIEQPDIILIDPFVGAQGKDIAIQNLLSTAKKAGLIVLTGEADHRAHRKAICMGAKGVVLKQETSETLIRAIKKVNAGEFWLERSTTASLLVEMLDTARFYQSDPEMVRILSLTQREREVAKLVADGLKNKQIAELLFISDATVSHHLTSIFAKLAVSDRLKLIVYCYRHGLANKVY